MRVIARIRLCRSLPRVRTLGKSSHRGRRPLRRTQAKRPIAVTSHWQSREHRGCEAICAAMHRCSRMRGCQIGMYSIVAKGRSEFLPGCCLINHSRHERPSMVEKRPKGTLNPPVVDLVSMTQGLLVAECLSFRRAARMLGTTQSVVSRRVRTLEDRLGVSLLERHRSGLRVTAAGARFFEQAREIDQQIEFAIKTAGAAGRGAIGRLNIGIVSSMAAGFLREVLRAYHAGHPDVLVHVLEGASNEQIALVRKSRLDVGFVLGTPDLPHCDVTRLWSERIYAAIPQGHLLR